MAKVLIGTTGSVAALKTPELVRGLIQQGHEVKVVATEASLYFYSLEELPPGTLHTESDEWPRVHTGQLWQRTDPILHIELRRWAELLLVAPMDANSLSKFAFGICNNSLSCVWRAWDLNRPIVLAPAMNTLMWEHPQTAQHLRMVMQLFVKNVPDNLDQDDLLEWYQANAAPKLRFIGPISKKLACGDVGAGAMAEVTDLLAAVQQMV